MFKNKRYRTACTIGLVIGGLALLGATQVGLSYGLLDKDPPPTDKQIGMAMVVLGISSGAAMACNPGATQDLNIAMAFLKTLPQQELDDTIPRSAAREEAAAEARRHGTDQRKEFFLDTFKVSAVSALGNIPTDRNFPAICSTAVPEMIEKADPMRKKIVQWTR